MARGLRFASALFSHRDFIRGRVALLATSLLLGSCAAETERSDRKEEVVGKVTQAITDTDGDSLDDGWETQFFGSLAQTAAGDPDADGMTNLEEYQNSFNPTVDDGLEDADFDRYPNVWEVRRGSDPRSASSLPTANYVVNGAGGGTHTTVSAALGAANVANGAY